MLNTNNVTLSGHLAQAPKVFDNRTLFTVAVNKSWRDPETGERKTAVNFIPCIAWGKTAEHAAKAAQGEGVFLEAELVSKRWEKDGETQYGLDVRVKRFQRVTAPSMEEQE